jgi:hypothetical protein
MLHGRHFGLSALLLGACLGVSAQGGASGAAPSGLRSKPMASSNGAPQNAAAGIPTARLADLFPGGLAGWSLKSLEEPLPPPTPLPGPKVALNAVYTKGSERIEINLLRLAAGTVAKGARPVTAERRADRGDTLVTLSLANGLRFAATSRTADAAAIEALLRGIDLARAEALVLGGP